MRHVALVGLTGVGKSTLVNVLKGSRTAQVTNDVVPCTIQASHYDIVEEDVIYRVWDTRGLNEASEQGAKTPLARFLNFIRGMSEADHELRKFLRGNDPKINLILFCIDAKKIGVKEQWKNYDKICVKFCRKKVKVAVVVTRMERDIRDTNWKRTCEEMAKEVVGARVGVHPDARLIEEVPAFNMLEETADCRVRLLRLLSDS